MKKLILSIALIGAAIPSFAQGYQFSDIVRNPVSPVKNQASTGTCWCFSTISFLEAELIRTGKGVYDLSEMFVVRQKYMNQLEDNYYRRGKGNLGQGSLSHTALNAIRQVGIVPEEVYDGINYDSPTHNHGELNRFVNAISNTAVEMKKMSPEYYKLVNSLFDIYLGPLPEKFNYNGKEYTPKSFWTSLGLNLDDYVELTSFSHKPYYEPFEVEVRDNWEHEKMYNLPIDELIKVMDHALEKGYTIEWDGDVSEKGFSHANGVAINPQPQVAEEALKFQKPCEEINVTAEVRQQGYENFTTTDDHLMHITGIVKDQNGTKYYITKNSWGTARNNFGGYLNMSESYVRAKTILIMVHKNSIPKEIKTKLGIK